MRQWLLVVIPAVVVLGVGIAIGILVGRDTKGSSVRSDTAVPVSAVGNPSAGESLWQAKGCNDCHSLAGQGGTDAPPLDFMRGKLSTRDIADMSGVIWNHAPDMAMHFSEEKLPYPSFSPGEMADLIAYLHGGPPPAP